MKLKTLLGSYPVTQAIRDGRVGSSLVELQIADVKVPHTAFKRVVRDLEFDVAEIAIVTFLMARSFGKPYKLLPAVMFGRFQHPYLMYNAERGKVAPKDLRLPVQPKQLFVRFTADKSAICGNHERSDPRWPIADRGARSGIPRRRNAGFSRAPQLDREFRFGTPDWWG